MPDPVLQMAPRGQPMATGKAHVLPRGPWVAMSEPRLYSPHSPCQALTGRGPSEIRAGEDTWCVVLAEGGVWLTALLPLHFPGHW